MTPTRPVPAKGRWARPRARRARLPEAETGLMTRAAFAAQHGVSEVTVRTWVRRGLPCIRVGGLVYFRISAARQWFAEQETGW